MKAIQFLLDFYGQWFTLQLPEFIGDLVAAFWLRLANLLCYG